MKRTHPLYKFSVAALAPVLALAVAPVLMPRTTIAIITRAVSGMTATTRATTTSAQPRATTSSEMMTTTPARAMPMAEMTTTTTTKAMVTTGTSISIIVIATGLSSTIVVMPTAGGIVMTARDSPRASEFPLDTAFSRCRTRITVAHRLRRADTGMATMRATSWHTTQPPE